MLLALEMRSSTAMERTAGLQFTEIVGSNIPVKDTIPPETPRFSIETP
jgi:hypothetical protein